SQQNSLSPFQNIPQCVLLGGLFALALSLGDIGVVNYSLLTQPLGQRIRSHLPLGKSNRFSAQTPYQGFTSIDFRSILIDKTSYTPHHIHTMYSKASQLIWMIWMTHIATPEIG